jgi:hypothetical protein
MLDMSQWMNIPNRASRYQVMRRSRDAPDSRRPAAGAGLAESAAVGRENACTGSSALAADTASARSKAPGAASVRRTKSLWWFFITAIAKVHQQ